MSAGGYALDQNNIDWIKDLVRGEQQMEEAGVIDFSPAFDPANILLKGTVEFLQSLKAQFIRSATVFNQLKNTNLGQIKIYGISKTHSDFMLFRNGYKLIFSMSEPGKIVIQFHHLATPFMGEQNSKDGGPMTAHSVLEAQWGAFGELIWTNKSKPINSQYLVRYYLKHFVHNSTK